MTNTTFENLSARLKEGGQVNLHRSSVSMDIRFTPACDLSDEQEPFDSASQSFSSALISCEARLSGREIVDEPHRFIDATMMDEIGIRPIDQLPILNGSDLRLQATNDGMLELSLLAWDGEARARFIGDTVEEVLNIADAACTNPERLSEIYNS